MNKLIGRLVNIKQFIWVICFLILIVATPCMSQVLVTSAGGSFPLFNGQDTSAWNQTGNANWYPINNGVAVNQGSGMLVGKYPFTDYQLQFNYKIDGANQFSLFTHCLDPNNIAPNSAIEINLSSVPIKGYGAGSVMGLIKAPKILVANQWNTVFISSESNQLTVILNGITVANKLDYQNFQTGPLAIQFGGGKLEITNFSTIIPGRW
jgi:hypothetical protein